MQIYCVASITVHCTTLCVTSHWNTTQSCFRRDALRSSTAACAVAAPSGPLITVRGTRMLPHEHNPIAQHSEHAELARVHHIYHRQCQCALVTFKFKLLLLAGQGETGRFSFSSCSGTMRRGMWSG